MRSILFLLTFLSCELAFSQSHFGAVSVGNGKTGRAAVQEEESLYLNPAAISHLNEGSAIFGNTQQNSEVFSSWDYGMIVSENGRDKLFPASLGVRRGKINFHGAQDLEYQDIQWGMARHFKKYFAVGVSYRYYETRFAKDSEYQSNFTLGGLFTPIENLGLGLVVYDIFTPGHSIDAAVRLQRRWGAGVTYLVNEFVRVHVDASGGSLKGSGRPIVAVGGESFVSKFWAFRAGMEKDPNKEANTTGLGVGFIGPRFQIQYGFQNSGDIKGFRSHSVDFSMPF